LISSADEDEPDWGYEVYSDRVLEMITSLQQSDAKQRVSDRLDMASSLLVANSSSHSHSQKHGEIIRAFLRHKLLAEANANNSTESNDDSIVWSNLDHETLALVIEQADKTLHAQIELMTDQFLAQAQDEATHNNQR